MLFCNRILTETPLGPFLRRFLLDTNGFFRLRELASQIPDLPPLYFPMHRLNASAHAHHVTLAEGPWGAEKVLASGLGGVARSSSVLTDGLPSPHLHSSRVEAFFNAYASGQRSPVHVLETVLAAISSKQHTYRAFAASDALDVRAQAAASAARWVEKAPLSVFDGVPVAVKEMVPVRGYVTGDGSASNARGSPAAIDDVLVARLRALGAVIVGITTMTEGGVTPLGFSVHSQGPFNPHNVSHYSGGSSSGSAVAVALGLCPLAVGFDGGGSIRIPASMSGVVCDFVWGNNQIIPREGGYR
jgi:hypothetical protein